jgi:Holliday junction resolvase-like predicted endonuclease
VGGALQGEIAGGAAGSTQSDFVSGFGAGVVPGLMAGVSAGLSAGLAGGAFSVGQSVLGTVLCKTISGVINVGIGYGFSLLTGEDYTLQDALKDFSIGFILGACFTGETRILTRRGWVRMDELTEADEVASAQEHDPSRPVEFKPVLELYHFPPARICHVHVKGQVIRTTPAHPFYVWGKGWMAAKELLPGDRLRSHDGRMVTVDEVFDSETEEPVYNCAIADYHTYFVGASEWGFSVWAHNKCSRAQLAANKAAGTAAENAAKAWLQKIGVEIVQDQARVTTKEGLRVIDFLVKHGGKYMAIEIKSGNAGRKMTQYLKDEAMAMSGGLWNQKGKLTSLPPLPTTVLYF